MNILIIGSCSEEFCNLIKQSKYSTRVYTATSYPLDNFPNVDFQSIEDLCEKAKVLHIDVAILMDKSLIKQGVVELFKKNRVNLISPNSKWFNLETSRIIAKQLAYHYSINTPLFLKAPVAFPIVMKTDIPKCSVIVNSIEELVAKKQDLGNEKTFLEEFFQGEVCSILLLWDGKTLLDFEPEDLTEVQSDRLKLFITKLSFLLSDENADFIGFFVSKLIWSKNDWYLLEFKMGIDENLAIKTLNKDIVYLIKSAIYQNLNEL